MRIRSQHASKISSTNNYLTRQFGVMALTIAISGSAALQEASADMIKISLLEHGNRMSTNVAADDLEIGSTLVMKVKKIKIDHSQLGSYSREDGSRAGAYGDGEYGD